MDFGLALVVAPRAGFFGRALAAVRFAAVRFVLDRFMPALYSSGAAASIRAWSAGPLGTYDPAFMILDRATIFALHWAAVLVHQADEGRFATVGLDVVLNVAAIAVLVRPTSLVRLGALCAVQLLGAAIAFPYVTNHLLLMTAVDGMILCALVVRFSAPRDASDDARAGVVAAIAPPARAALVLVYAFGAFAKLNADFLDPDLSCAPALLGRIRGLLPALPMPGERTAIWATVGVEVALPLLLLGRRTWRAGIALGGALHLLLALAGLFEFAAVGLALYTLYLPADLALRVPLARTLPSTRRGGSLVVIGVAATVCYALMHSWRLEAVARVLPALAASSPSGRLAGLLWLPLGAGSLGALVRLVQARPDAHASPRGGPAAAAAWAVTLLVALNGLAPYVGLKTEASYTMFSNLRTEGGLWNHLILPVDVRIFALQNDLVRPLDASDAWLRARARAGERLVFLGFHHYASRRPELRVRYERAGEVREVERVALDPLLSRPVPYLLRKLLWFKPVPSDGRNACQH